MNNRTKLGLVGRNIQYSFSKKYFSDKFKKLQLTHLSYKNYDLPEVDEFPFIIYHIEDEFLGFNVTIPYKKSILKYIDELDEVATKIKAVNTIKMMPDNTLKGFNTDVYGFEKSIVPLLESHHNKALILGTGGASDAIAYVLAKLGIDYKFVSRTKESNNTISYQNITKEVIKSHTIIINCTPVGTSPNIDKSPNIPYEFITSEHLLYDLIYNPQETKFLYNGKKQGAKIKNGLEMLELQAEKSWEIWNS